MGLRPARRARSAAPSAASPITRTAAWNSARSAARSSSAAHAGLRGGRQGRARASASPLPRKHTAEVAIAPRRGAREAKGTTGTVHLPCGSGCHSPSRAGPRSGPAEGLTGRGRDSTARVPGDRLQTLKDRRARARLHASRLRCLPSPPLYRPLAHPELRGRRGGAVLRRPRQRRLDCPRVIAPPSLRTPTPSTACSPAHPSLPSVHRGRPGVRSVRLDHGWCRIGACSPFGAWHIDARLR